MHQAAIAWDLTPLNWSGSVEVVSALDGRVVNKGVARYRQLEGRHLDPQGPRIEGSDVIALKARTRQSRIEVAEAARTRVFRGGEELDVARAHLPDGGLRPAGAGVRAAGGGDRPGGEERRALHLARPRHQRAAGGRGQERHPLPRRSTRHSTARRGPGTSSGRSATSTLPREERVQFLLRFHTAHLLQVCSRQTAHHDAGVPARGLNGEAYRGHVFWDELFVYPFLNFRLPMITRGLLLYRYRRIGEARAAARQARLPRGDVPVAERQRRPGGDADASTSTRCPGRWEPDLSRNQRHVGAAIFYAVWHYHLATNDARLPARLRRRDDAGDRPLLGLDRALQPRAGPLGDPRRDGAGRVPREVPGRHRGGPAQQRLHERDGGLDRPRPRSGCSSSCRRAAATRCASASASPTRRSAPGRR